MKRTTRRAALAALAGAGLSRAAGTRILVHEHILVDFIGADEASPSRYDANAVFAAARPKLEALLPFGVKRFQECTPNFLGRDVRLLDRLSQATGMEIWTNTGLYSANRHKHLPAYARTESAAQLAARWVGEARKGIDGVTPRFIKIGVDKGPLDPLDRKIVEAAAHASRDTGMTVAAHTGDGAAALEQIELFASKGGELQRFVWVHAQNEKNHEVHFQVAKAGAWVEFDGVNEQGAEWHIECISAMAGANLLRRTLLSQDSGWYHVGEPDGGNFRGYTYLFEVFLKNLDDGEVRQLLEQNPVAAFGG